MSAKSLTVFNGTDGQSLVAAKVSKSGTTYTYISKKDYGIKFKLKGAELRNAHEKYRAEFGLAGNGSLAQSIAKGELIMQKAKDTKTGMIATFVRRAVLPVPMSPVEAAKTLTDEQLLAMLADRKKNPAAGAAAIEA